MRRQILLLLCGAGVAVRAIPACGFPIEPVSLRKLVIESDLVAVARVVPKPEDRFFMRFDRSSPARLRLSSVLKGESNTDVIDVHFDAGLVCPAPPDFPFGTNMLVYLKKTGKGYEPVALSYGVKVASDEAIGIYSQRIRELVEIQKITNTTTKRRQMVEWLVDCAEHPVTRWEGAFELADRITLLPNATNASPFVQYLTASHLARLSNAVFKTELVGSGDLELCSVFEKQARGRVIQYLTDYLHKVKHPLHPINDATKYDALAQPYMVYFVMYRLADLLNDPAAKEFVKGRTPTWFDGYVERTNSIRLFLPLIERKTKGPSSRASGSTTNNLR
jgi:hypothetical protein